MNLRHGTLRLLINAAAFVCLVGGPNYVRGQQTPDKWERVHTGQEYIIEINVSHVKLEPECRFQTSLVRIFGAKKRRPLNHISLCNSVFSVYHEKTLRFD